MSRRRPTNLPRTAEGPAPSIYTASLYKSLLSVLLIEQCINTLFSSALLTLLLSSLPFALSFHITIKNKKRVQLIIPPTGLTQQNCIMNTFCLLCQNIMFKNQKQKGCSNDLSPHICWFWMLSTSVLGVTRYKNYTSQ